MASVIVSPIPSLRAFEAIQGSSPLHWIASKARKDGVLDTGDLMTEAYFLICYQFHGLKKR